MVNYDYGFKSSFDNVIVYFQNLKNYNFQGYFYFLIKFFYQNL
jgi:hypothetical protein